MPEMEEPTLDGICIGGPLAGMVVADREIRSDYRRMSIDHTNISYIHVYEPACEDVHNPVRAGAWVLDTLLEAYAQKGG